MVLLLVLLLMHLAHQQYKLVVLVTMQFGFMKMELSLTNSHYSKTVHQLVVVYMGFWCWNSGKQRNGNYNSCSRWYINCTKSFKCFSSYITNFSWRDLNKFKCLCINTKIKLIYQIYKEWNQTKFHRVKKICKKISWLFYLMTL